MTPIPGSYWIGGYYNLLYIVVEVKDDTVHYKRVMERSATYRLTTESFLCYFRPETKLEFYLRGADE